MILHISFLYISAVSAKKTLDFCCFFFSIEHNVRMLTDFAVATQSSTFVSDNMLWSAEKVLDGCYDKSCTARTRGERHNWIRLDLGNVYNISTVAIYAVTEESCK